MATIYRTRDGDVLDQICNDYYGRSSAIIDVYDANPGLVDYGAILPAGIEITLPDLAAPVAQGTSLWD
ncbi:tail protein X [Celerinatantimonas sp. MCCC 1A17872]|uniref:tail protein X n=1 Tax=Celerinatantimonas sp. MCCC 1A17872 TaxID=3177514 RepID=UPI0038CA1F14